MAGRAREAPGCGIGGCELYRNRRHKVAYRMPKDISVIKDVLAIGKETLTFAALIIGCYTSILTHRRRA